MAGVVVVSRLLACLVVGLMEERWKGRFSVNGVIMVMQIAGLLVGYVLYKIGWYAGAVGGRIGGCEDFVR